MKIFNIVIIALVLSSHTALAARLTERKLFTLEKSLNSENVLNR